MDSARIEERASVEYLLEAGDDSAAAFAMACAAGTSLLFAQFSAFDFAISSSRRAFAGALELPDHSTRSTAAYTLGYCADPAWPMGRSPGVRELVRLADTALYDAKQAGRDRLIAI